MEANPVFRIELLDYVKRAAELLQLLDLLFSNTILCVRRAELRRTAGAKEDVIARCLKIIAKSLIQHCQRSELCLQNVKNGQFWRVFENM